MVQEYQGHRGTGLLALVIPTYVNGTGVPGPQGYRITSISYPDLREWYRNTRVTGLLGLVIPTYVNGTGVPGVPGVQGY